MSSTHRGSVVPPRLEVISSTDGTNRAELIALPAARAGARTERVLHQVVVETMRAERRGGHAPDLPPAA